MAYIFAGEDTYESYTAAKVLAGELAVKLYSEVLILDADDLPDVSSLSQHLEAVAMFGANKVVVAKRLLANSRLVNYVEKNWGSPALNNLIIWHDAKPDMRSRLSKLAKESKSLQTFELGKPRDVIAWLKSYLSSQKTFPSLQNYAAYLVERVGLDKWALTNEINKIALYTGATGDHITEELIDSLIGVDSSGDIWKMLDKLASGRKQEAMQEMEKLMAYADNTQYIISMLSREVSLMAKVKQSTDTRSLGLHPFVLEKTQAKAARFTWEKLQKLAAGLLRLDYGIKQGRIDAHMALTMYFLSW